MEIKNPKRKLTAILCADVSGYSRLMEDDDEATVLTIKAYRKVMADHIAAYDGRVVDAQGDNLLAELPSAMDAVKCAIAIQGELEAKNARLTDHRRMQFRIGINVGDVIEEEGNLYGNGVNIAARLETLTPPGEVSISGAVFDQLTGNIDFHLEPQGEQRVKNIAAPVRVYRVTAKAPAELSEKRTILGISDRPSIAVLPFVNMSGDAEQDYFSDGITEDLITDLSKISGLFVIARNSVFVYKGKAVKVEEIGRELGVRYVLEGSVRKSGNKVRITTQLIDASTKGHIWADRFDSELGNIFDLQDEITCRIVSKLSLELKDEERRRLARKGTRDVNAYDYVLRGSNYLSLYTKEANAHAKDLFLKAVDLDPEYALAYSLISVAHFAEWAMGWSKDPGTMENALKLAQKSVAMDDALPTGHLMLGMAYLWKKQHEHAIEELETALNLDPNNAEGYAFLGNAFTWAGRFEEAIDAIENALRRNPYHQATYLFRLGQAFSLMGRYDKAIEVLTRALADTPNLLPAYGFLAFAYIKSGKRELGRTQIQKILQKNPDYSIETLRDTFPLKDKEKLEEIATALFEAGLT